MEAKLGTFMNAVLRFERRFERMGIVPENFFKTIKTSG